MIFCGRNGLVMLLHRRIFVVLNKTEAPALMIAVLITGINNGEYPFEVVVSVGDIPMMPEEFLGKVEVSGVMYRSGNTIVLKWIAEASAEFVCDRSLEVYTEMLKVSFMREYIQNNQLASGFNPETVTDGDIIPVREDVRQIDFTDDVRQELAVHMPMKRISPRYRDIPFEAIHPDKVGGFVPNESSDERWAPLRNLKP